MKIIQFIIFLLLITLQTSCSSDLNFKLEETLNNEDPNQVIIDIDLYLNEKSQYGQNIEELNESQKVFIFVENLEREVNNGGFNQFYYNSSGDFSEESVEALISIGANNTAEIVKLANSQFENGMVPKNRLIRQIELEKIENKAQANWDKCDEKFHLYQDDLTELLWDFIIKNKSDFKN